MVGVEMKEAVRPTEANISGSEYTQLECDINIEQCGSEGNCTRSEKCAGHDDENGQSTRACVTVWRNNTENRVQIMAKYCMKVQTGITTCGGHHCIADEPRGEKDSASIFTCCCTEPMCNSRFSYIPKSQSTMDISKNTTSGIKAGTLMDSNADGLAINLAYFLCPLFLLLLLVALIYGGYRRHRLWTINQHSVGYTAGKHAFPLVRLKSDPAYEAIQFDQLISKGRYGCVWKARLWQTQTVAVKVFAHGEAESWIREQEIYVSRGMKEHENILQFITATVRGTGLGAEYWLVTTYHQHGSLYEFLKQRVLNISDALRLAVGVLRGLTFLHDENQDKPTIVHRDMKSKNVLVKSDMTACISDFGLALKSVTGQPQIDVHIRVGTSQYMAPEVLQGATEFSTSAFRHIDVYACALVLWEIISRTSFDEEVVDKYQLPFEEYLPPNLKFQEAIVKMQDVVVVQKKRPALKQCWSEHPRGGVICATIREMWDTEAEARLTAGCALGRFQALQATMGEPGSLWTDSTDCSTSPLIPDYNCNVVHISNNDNSQFISTNTELV